MLYPRYQYTLAYDVLRDSATHQEYRTLLGFFNLMKGGFDTFLFTDPDDYTVTDMQFGTGNGSTTAFQLFRTFGGFADPVFDLNGAPAIKVNGVTKSAGSDYNIGSTGVVTFAAAPANGANLAWTGSFYWRCSFADDSMDIDKFMYQLWQAKKVVLKTMKP
jgi:uncharacterized protein (TIGR02217 family)